MITFLTNFMLENMYWKLFRTLHSAQKVMKAKNVVNCQRSKSWRFLSRKLLFTCKMVTISIKKDKTYPFVKHEPLHELSLNWTINLDFFLFMHLLKELGLIHLVIHYVWSRMNIWHWYTYLVHKCTKVLTFLYVVQRYNGKKVFYSPKHREYIV